MPTNDPAQPAPGDAHVPLGERALAKALEGERRRVRRLRALLVLTLAGAGVMAALWGGAVAKGRRMAEQTLTAERDRMEAERQRDLAQLTAERARADAGAARLQEERERYARNIQLAHQAWSGQDTHRALELLEGIPPERRGWEWRHLWRPDPHPKAKE